VREHDFTKDLYDIALEKQMYEDIKLDPGLTGHDQPEYALGVEWG
jgi:hypothetical protein